MQEKNTLIIESIFSVASSVGSVWSFLKGGISFLGIAYLGPIGGLICSIIAFILLNTIKKQNIKNPYIHPIALFLSIVAFIVIIFFAISGALMPFYDRSFFGEKKGGPTDYIPASIDGISTKVMYKIKAEPHQKTSLEVLFLTEDGAVKELKVAPNFTTPLGDTKNSVDRLTVKSTVVELKKKGFMFSNVEDANGCDVKLNVILFKEQRKKVIIDILYTYYSLSKWQKFLRWLLERYYT